MKGTTHLCLFLVIALGLGGCVMVDRPGKPSIEVLDKQIPAATNGNVQANYLLGMAFFSNGISWQAQGVGSNPEMGLHYLIQAAEQGYGPAQSALGRYYREGTLFPSGTQTKPIAPDLPLAAYWLLRAAEQGENSAYYQLSDLYTNPQFPQANLQEACKWALVSFEKSNYCINKKMPPEQIEAALQAAKRWKAQHPATRP